MNEIPSFSAIASDKISKSAWEIQLPVLSARFERPNSHDPLCQTGDESTGSPDDASALVKVRQHPQGLQGRRAKLLFCFLPALCRTDL